MTFTFLAQAFGALFAIMNPFLNLPMFLALTEGYDVKRQRQTAIRVVLYSAILSVIILATGNAVLKLFGISVDDFRIAGGIVMLTIALGMLNGSTTTHSGNSDEQKQQGEHAQQSDVAFYPMAFPMIVGPGTITTIVVLAGGAGVAQHLTIAVVLAGLLATMLAVLWFAPAIGRHMSLTLRTIVTRLMGMILAAIAVAMVVAGLGHVFPGLRH